MGSGGGSGGDGGGGGSDGGGDSICDRFTIGVLGNAGFLGTCVGRRDVNSSEEQGTEDRYARYRTADKKRERR